MKLLSPKGMDVRPMMEVVKGAAFDILQVDVVLSSTRNKLFTSYTFKASYMLVWLSASKIFSS